VSERERGEMVATTTSITPDPKPQSNNFYSNKIFFLVLILSISDIPPLTQAISPQEKLTKGSSTWSAHGSSALAGAGSYNLGYFFFKRALYSSSVCNKIGEYL